ncbi:hypothetical protein PHYPO_G00184730 [Pangasianodon hypophthalmus]|uniref:Uncharacterized protein n=1 Tax=Pangasianodon hypophthalmus TaxID=310915 RepID=A0A5N5JHT3_PANHP|nr:hypothetical protein PHYPO_G00184730 [Pangasianodon hypophthalmus]
MELHTVCVLLLLAVCVGATPDRYYVQKQQSYPVKAQELSGAPGDLLDHLDHQDILHLESLEVQVHRENQVKMECLEKEDILDLEDPKEQEDLREPPAALVLLVSPLLESQDLTVYLGQWGLKENLVQKDFQVFLAYLDTKVNQVMVCKDVLVHLAKWVRWVLQVSLVNLELENLVQLDTLGNPESQVCQVEMGLQVPWVHKAQREPQALRV